MRRIVQLVIGCAAFAAAVSLVAGVAYASDLKSDLNTATASMDRNKDLGAALVGGETYTFTTGVYYNGGHDSATFAADVTPAFVTSVTGGTINDGGREDAVSSTITVVAPCELGAFGGEDTTEPIEAVSGSAVTYKIVTSVGSGGWTTTDAFVNIKGAVSSLGSNCATAPTFNGFYRPVDMGTGVTNFVKAGQGVPLKWNLYEDAAMTAEIIDGVIGDGHYAVTSAKVPCDQTGTGDAIPAADDAGSSGLHYENGENVYVWKTLKSWAQTCRTFTVSYGGASITAHFTFTK